jgi:hypothetical protein
MKTFLIGICLSLAIAASAGAETKTKLFDLFGYSPNSGTADACRLGTNPCIYVALMAETSIKDAFDAAVPSLVGCEVQVIGFFLSPSQFAVTEIPLLAPGVTTCH